jgi:hypothetical protein
MLTEAYLADQTDFVSQTVFPPIPVTNKSDEYFRYKRADFFRRTMQPRAPGTAAARAGYRLDTAEYNAREYALGHAIPDSIARNADNMLDLDRAGTELLTLQAMLDREYNWAAKYFVGGEWTTTMTGTSGAADATHVKQWDLAGSTPIDDVLAGKETIKQNTGKEPNVLVLGYRVKQRLKRNATIIDLLKYGQTAPGPVVVKNSDLAAVFEVDKVVVMGAIQCTSAEDAAADTFDFIGGDNALLAYAAPSPGLMVVSAGWTFNWQGFGGSMPGGTGWRMKKYRWEIEESNILEIQQAYAFGLAAPDLGYLFVDVIS